jgi:hypothetical protein
VPLPLAKNIATSSIRAIFSVPPTASTGHALMATPIATASSTAPRGHPCSGPLAAPCCPDHPPARACSPVSSPQPSQVRDRQIETRCQHATPHPQLRHDTLPSASRAPNSNPAHRWVTGGFTMPNQEDQTRSSIPFSLPVAWTPTAPRVWGPLPRCNR